MTDFAYIELARKVDTEIARLWNEFHAVNDQIPAIRKTIKDVAKYTFLSAEQKAERTAKAEAKIFALTEQATPLLAAVLAYEEANYTGWNRFFLVKHIHSSTRCSSFRMTTRVAWLPQLSGQTEAEAVAEHGAILCTICFPSAPIEWTKGIVDPNVCTGSGKNIDSKLPNRFGFYSGNYATCPDCGKRTGVSSSAVKIPKHKVAK